MKPDDFVIALRCKDEPNLKHWAEHHAPMCRGFIIIDDRSAKPVADLKLPRVLFLGRKEPELFDEESEHTCALRSELQDWRALWEMALTTSARWLIHLDADEYLSSTFLEEMVNIGTNKRAAYFVQLIMHPDADHFICEGIYQPRGKIIAGRLDSRLTYRNESPPMHLPRIPAWDRDNLQQVKYSASEIYRANALLFHHNMYGDRPNRRYDRLTKLDADGRYYAPGYSHILKKHLHESCKDIQTVRDLFRKYPKLVPRIWNVLINSGRVPWIQPAGD